MTTLSKTILLSSLIILTSCTLKGGNDTGKTVAPEQTSTAQTMSQTTETPKNGMVTLNYTLREGSPTGKILETTLVDVAKANGLYSSGAKYEPFQFVLGTSAVVPGFEKGVSMMKKGEKKTIEVLPKDGYGESTREETVTYEKIAPKFTKNLEKKMFLDRVNETVDRKMLGEQGKDLQVGKTLTGGSQVSAKVTKIDGDNITIEIDNKANPFYGKALKVGVVGEQEVQISEKEKAKVKFTIKALSETGITLDIENGTSPFAGKEFKVGATASLPMGGNITVKDIQGENITIQIPNSHPLAGKTLYFDIEIVDIQ